MMKRTKAFTLIELLVVVAIIALLISILLPTLNKAKEVTRRVVCAAHLKGCGQATMFYVHANDKWLPTVGSCVTTYDSWGGKLGALLPSYTVRLINPYVGEGGAVSLTDTGIYEIFRCPSDNGATPGCWPWARLPTYFDSLGSSYFYNSSANNNDGSLGLWAKKITQIVNPTKVVMASDWPFNCHFWNCDPFMYSYWHDENELGWANVVFVDSHVAYLRATIDNPDFQNGPNWTFIYNGR